MSFKFGGWWHIINGLNSRDIHLIWQVSNWHDQLSHIHWINKRINFPFSIKVFYRFTVYSVGFYGLHVLALYTAGGYQTYHMWVILFWS